MSEHKILEDPTNRIVAVFNHSDQAEKARKDLLQHGLEGSHIRVLQGEDLADKVDTSAKWFADTDKELEKYQRALSVGYTVISLPVEDREGREALHAILKRHDAHLITHFGEWVTEMMR